MRRTYRVLAYLIAILVMVQAAAIAFALSGLGKWVADGGVLDAAGIESGSLDFEGVVGFMIHGLNGTMVIPVVALALLIISFFTKIPGASKWAALVFLLVGIQIGLGLTAHAIPTLGAVHGVNALLLFSAAVYAARRSRGLWA